MEYHGILAIFWIKRVRMKRFFDLKQLCGSIIPRRAPNTSRTLEALFTPYKFSGRLDSPFNKINALGKLKKKQNGKMNIAIAWSYYDPWIVRVGWGEAGTSHIFAARMEWANNHDVTSFKSWGITLWTF